jgi:hypothetical protein
MGFQQVAEERFEVFRNNGFGLRLGHQLKDAPSDCVTLVVLFPKINERLLGYFFSFLV